MKGGIEINRGGTTIAALDRLVFYRAKKWQDERDAEARRYHKDTSTLSVKVRTDRLAAS